MIHYCVTTCNCALSSCLFIHYFNLLLYQHNDVLSNCNIFAGCFTYSFLFESSIALSFVEPSLSDSSSNTALSTNAKHVEFPLYLDGQDTTKAAYAVFLLNKVCFSFSCYFYALLRYDNVMKLMSSFPSLLAFFIVIIGELCWILVWH